MQNWTPSRSTRFHKSFASKHPHIFRAVRICVIVFGSCAALLVIQLLLGFLFRMLYQATNFSATVLQAIYSALSYLLAILVVLKVTRIIQKEPVSKKHTLGLSGLPTWLDLGLAPIAFIIYVILAAILTNLFSIFPWFDPSQPQDTGFNLFLAGIDRVIVFFILVLSTAKSNKCFFKLKLFPKISRKKTRHQKLTYRKKPSLIVTKSSPSSSLRSSLHSPSRSCMASGTSPSTFLP